MTKVWDINSQEYKDEIARIEKEAYEKAYIDARKALYDLGLQIGALMKQANYDRLQGKELIQELDDALGHVQSVKNQVPKPTEEVTDEEVEDDRAE